MPMKNPPHPGKVVRVSCLEPLGLSVTEGAETWIRLQAAYDIARAIEREDEIEVERYEPQPV